MGQTLYNSNDGLTGRDGGPYLDIEEAKAAEVRRAAVEGREPDFSNMASSSGIQLNTAAQMLSTVTVNRPSGDVSVVKDAERTFKASENDAKTNLSAWAEIPDLPTEGVNDEVVDDTPADTAVAPDDTLFS